MYRFIVFFSCRRYRIELDIMWCSISNTVSTSIRRVMNPPWNERWVRRPGARATRNNLQWEQPACEVAEGKFKLYHSELSAHNIRHARIWSTDRSSSSIVVIVSNSILYRIRRYVQLDVISNSMSYRARYHIEHSYILRWILTPVWKYSQVRQPRARATRDHVQPPACEIAEDLTNGIESSIYIQYRAHVYYRPLSSCCYCTELDIETNSIP